jgi:cobyrinic acid a,c-diamide synthase
LPEGLHGLYFGGGFPEVFAQELENNREIRQAIKEIIEGGIPTYAECGGFMYLTNAIASVKGESHEMVGVFDTETKMTGRLQRFGYVDVTIDQPSVLSNSVETAKAHEFHRSILTNELEEEQVYQLRKTRNGEIIDHWRCGLKRHNALAAYAHIHFYCNPRLAENFIENCRVYKDGGRNK